MLPLVPKVSGVYAYTSRKASNWVPDVVFNLAKDAQREKQGAPRVESSVPSSSASRLGSTATSSRDQTAGGGREHRPAHDDASFRCQTCGATCRDEASLTLHVRSVHGSASVDGGTNRRTGDRRPPGRDRGASRRVEAGGGGGGSRVPLDAPRNSSERATGRVASYRNSVGVVFTPPVGHQLSLRYAALPPQCTAATPVI